MQRGQRRKLASLNMFYRFDFGTTQMFYIIMKLNFTTEFKKKQSLKGEKRMKQNKTKCVLRRQHKQRGTPPGDFKYGNLTVCPW